MTSLGTLTGVEIEAMSDDELRDALRRTTNLRPGHSRAQIEDHSRPAGARWDVGFLGDGVNERCDRAP